jgi:hypothetical protein
MASRYWSHFKNFLERKYGRKGLEMRQVRDQLEAKKVGSHRVAFETEFDLRKVPT